MWWYNGWSYSQWGYGDQPQGHLIPVAYPWQPRAMAPQPPPSQGKGLSPSPMGYGDGKGYGKSHGKGHDTGHATRVFCHNADDFRRAFFKFQPEH